MKEKWFIKNKAGDFETIGRNHGIDPVLAQLIVNRGINGNEEMKRYLYPTMDTLHNPRSMKDLEKACMILKEKIAQNKRIRVIGDYDVDGVMSTYILVRALCDCGANADYEIPDRMKDGYGINTELVKTAIEEAVDTIITCDNGIAARDAIALAKSHGLTVIVTDHHEIPMEGIPDADAVVNPKQEACQYPYKGICGAMVAYKLVAVLYEAFGFSERKHEQLVEYVAIATVCDVMELLDENRAIVKAGLDAFSHTNNVGLVALKEACGLSGKKINAYHFGFVIGPCINASGRLESAKLSLRLLLCQDNMEAKQLANSLKLLNDERKKMTEENLEQAIWMVEHSDLIRDKILVVYLKECHESLAGIIAGRLRERYNRPCLVLTKSEQGVKGSGRSIEEYHMFLELSKVSDFLLKFGGHPMAAGLSLCEEHVDLLRKRLNQETTLTFEELIPRVSFDCILPADKIEISFARQLECLEPYGKGNEKPLFVMREVEFLEAQVLGANQNVLKCKLITKESGRMYTAMLFQNIQKFEEALEEKYGEGAFVDLLSRKKHYTMDIVFSLGINEFNGMESVQLLLTNYR